jgi:hypothetical protein
MGAPDHLMGLMGATLPFAPTQREREVMGDPRLSIAERYPSLADYLERVRKAAEALVAEGYVLGDDVDAVVEQAAHRYELLASHMPTAQAVGG